MGGQALQRKACPFHSWKRTGRTHRVHAAFFYWAFTGPPGLFVCFLALIEDVCICRFFIGTVEQEGQ